MGRAPASWEKDEEVNKCLWSPEEDEILRQTIHKHGVDSWSIISKKSGLHRSGGSCRKRWLHYLCPAIKRGPLSPEEESQLIQLQSTLGNNTTLSKEEKSQINDQPKEKPQINDHQSCDQSTLPLRLIMEQWERAGSSEAAEPRISMDLLLLNPSMAIKTEQDYFLKGKVGGACNSSGGVGSSSVDQLAMPFKTSTVCASTVTSLDQLEDSCEPKLGVVMAADSISSDTSAHSSDSFLKLLLDSPEGNDMEYLQGQGHSFSDPFDVDAADRCDISPNPQILL
ncbi:hypothetical protein Tsubulata_001656 [Turnera subulata]|uniref:Uncharacterized protein n=1 Tax=Turnera subulata TaxID=218843 RepID=A0A9Q0FU10_9ROSI|nr:hypothetical protein Tsubulata_001656 [Turnera subulata]